MLVLAVAGAAAFSFITPISVAIAALLFIVIISYRQTSIAVTSVPFHLHDSDQAESGVTG